MKVYILLVVFLFTSLAYSSTNRNLDTGTGINIASGSGDVSSSTSNATGSTASGAFLFTTGTSVDGASGQFNVVTGATSGAGVSGVLSLATGTTTAGANTGGANLATGGSTNNADNSTTGTVTIQTGTMTGTGANSQSGDIDLNTGGAVNYFSGAIVLTTGSSLYQTGDVRLITSNATAGANGYTGDVDLWTGIPDGTGVRGNVSVKAFDLKIDDGTHIVSATSTPPAVTTCGTGPSIAGTDVSGKVTVGTGGTSSDCLVTFARAFASAPNCFVNDETASLATRAVPTTTGVDLIGASAFAAGSVIDYFCVSN